MRWKDKVAPETGKVYASEAVCGDFHLCVHRYIGCGDIWFFSVARGPFDKHEIGVVSLEVAKQAAGRLFSDCLEKAMVDLEE